MELTAEQKVEKLTERIKNIQTIIRDPLSINDKLKLGKVCEQIFRALAEIGIPYGYVK